MPSRSRVSLALEANGSAGEPKAAPTTMIHALEHIPPAPAVALAHEELTPPSSRLGTPVDDLIPPPPLMDESMYVEEPVEKKPRKKRASKAVEPNGEATPATPAERASKKGVKEELGAEDVQPTPKRKRATKTAKAEAASVGVASEGETSEPVEKPKKKTPKKSRIAKDEPEYDSDGNEIVRKKRKGKVYPKIEYDIPPVERKETTFKGKTTP